MLAAGAMETLLNQPCVVLLYTKVAIGAVPVLPAVNPVPVKVAPVVILLPALILELDDTFPVTDTTVPV